MHWYFKQSSNEEREHAMKFLKYLNKRGGRIILQDIKSPDTPFELTAVEAMEKALELEKKVNEVRNIRSHFDHFSIILFYIVLVTPRDSSYRKQAPRRKFM